MTMYNLYFKKFRIAITIFNSQIRNLSFCPRGSNVGKLVDY